MWLLPFLIIGGIMALAGSRKPRGRVPRALPAPAMPYAPAPQQALAPTALAVMGEIVARGYEPPPEVVMGAIYEAEVAGCPQVADEIVATFVVPAMRGGRGTQPLPQAQRALPASTTTEPAGAGTHLSDAELRRMIDSDPAGFYEAATRAAQQQQQHQEQQAQPSYSQEDRVQMQQARPEPAPQPTPRAQRSPIEGVPADAWEHFVSCLEREAATYESPRHVGPYRQRRDRLAELGIDPKLVLASRGGARSALDTDLVNSYQHAVASGFVDDHYDGAIEVPGMPDRQLITLSGILGVIQSAGLEHAVDWFENPLDRKRYPHTTAAFARCNGVF